MLHRVIMSYDPLLKLLKLSCAIPGNSFTSNTAMRCAVCPVLQSLLQACIARLEELTKDTPQKPKDWACHATLECDAKDSPSANRGLCKTCCRSQAFLRDGSITVFTGTWDEVRHLSP